MKITKQQLKQIIKEELEVVLTNEEAGELFGEDFASQLNEGNFQEKYCEDNPNAEGCLEYWQEEAKELGIDTKGMSGGEILQAIHRHHSMR